MLKKAFTVAEVLITLAIIGVVASITLPSITTNINKAKIGPTLAKAANTMENANSQIMARYRMEELSKVLDKIGGDSYIDILNEMSTGTKFTEGGVTYFRTKDGIEYKKAAVDTNGNHRANCGVSGVTQSKKYSYTCYRVDVDINGFKKGKNKNNDDIFAFFIDDYGIVIPSGGLENRAYNGYYYTWDTCDTSGQPYCTGAIADNGWKMGK